MIKTGPDAALDAMVRCASACGNSRSRTTVGYPAATRAISRLAAGLAAELRSLIVALI
ncbi:hypothetical protein ACQP2E_19335 [Actinoplanes sp. CA-015351]|uniref:hypothetical protein n=1 Tax=Actinoplanes sp. CA-015351 TaxID=3239897 RepID=UPI003D9944FD